MPGINVSFPMGQPSGWQLASQSQGPDTCRAQKAPCPPPAQGSHVRTWSPSPPFFQERTHHFPWDLGMGPTPPPPPMEVEGLQGDMAQKARTGKRDWRCLRRAGLLQPLRRFLPPPVPVLLTGDFTFLVMGKQAASAPAAEQPHSGFLLVTAELKTATPASSTRSRAVEATWC